MWCYAFQRDPSTAEIPLLDTETVRSFQPTVTTDPASAIVKFEVKFDEQGKPGIMGLDIGSAVELSPELLSNLQKGDIQHAEIRTKPDGAYVYVNNEPLPRLVWDTKTLSNTVEFYSRLSPESALLPLIQQIGPYLDRLDSGILLHFPMAAGKTEIPAELH